MQRLSQQQRDDDELARLLGFPPSELDEPNVRDDPGTDNTAGLLEAARCLASDRETPPATAATAALATALLQQLGHEPQPEPAQAAPVSADGVLAVLLPQVRLLQAPFWLATAVVLLGGLALAAWIGAGSTSAAVYLVMIVPLLTALGVSFAYYTGDRLLELEATWPITPEQVIWGRTLLVVGYDIVLAVGASAVLAAVTGDLPWLALVTTWMAPLFGLAAVSLLAATHLGPWQGTAVSTGLWALGLVAYVRGWTDWFAVDALHSDVGLRALIAGVLGLALWLSLRHTAAVTRRRWLRLGWSG